MVGSEWKRWELHIHTPNTKKNDQFIGKTIQEKWEKYYEDISEYCKSASKDEVIAKDYSLVPSKYIEFVNRDENIDFDTKMTTLQSEFVELLKEEEKSKQELLTVFKVLGYEIKL